MEVIITFLEGWVGRELAIKNRLSIHISKQKRSN